MHNLLTAQAFGLYLLFLIIGVMMGYLIGNETAHRDQRRVRAAAPDPAVVEAARVEAALVAMPPAPARPTWLRDAEAEHPGDIERVVGKSPHFGAPYGLTGGHRHH